MRSLDAARESWQHLHHYPTLRELKQAVRLNARASVTTSGLRSVCWKAFLLFDTLDLHEWQRVLASSRSAYNSLHAHFFRFIENPDDLVAGLDPLTQDTESSPWQQFRKDEELRVEIVQDVERCMLEFTRAPDTQRMLIDILFTFCKLNPDIGYRQGMHEIAAHVLWVVQADSVDLGQASKAMGQDSIIKMVFDAEHVEHDSFTIFGQIMQSAKSFYLSEGPVSIATRSRHIFEELLTEIDPVLAQHLKSLDVLPQVFLIRWIRLLFVREFEFDDVLPLWDVLFAEDNSLELVNHICLAMLLRIRWHLLDADYNNALGLLLRYPELDKDLPAQTLALDALYLRSHMNNEGASYLVLKYTGRPLISDRPTTPPALQRNITTFSGINATRHAGRNSLSPPRATKQSRNIEGILQSTAKNIYARGEKLGINKAVRSAVDEVQKRAQEIREAQTPLIDQTLESLRELQDRNKTLSKLLSGALNELWEYQSLVATQHAVEHRTSSGSEPTEGFENTGPPSPGASAREATRVANVEKLSAAIAKVQFVQFYLDEPSLVLPEDEVRTDPGVKDSVSTEPQTQPEAPELSFTTAPQLISDTSGIASNSNAPVDLSGPKEGAIVNDGEEQPKQQTSSRESTEISGKGQASLSPNLVPSSSATATTTIPPAPTDLDGDRKPAVETAKSHSPRPSLEQSAFSFMLGQEKKPQPSRLHDSLFGGGGGGGSSSNTGLSGAKKDGSAEDPTQTNDEFDIGSLRRAKGRRT